MSAPEKQKLIVKGLYVNGKKCSNPTISFIDAPNAAVNCIDPDGCVFEFQVPDELAGQVCFDFLVKCDDKSACKNCETIVTKCICDNKSDCVNSCDECIGGFCENSCKTGEICDDICGCIPENCPNGKQVIDCKCSCATGTFENGNGDCVGCDENTELPCNQF